MLSKTTNPKINKKEQNKSKNSLELFLNKIVKLIIGIIKTNKRIN